VFAFYWRWPYLAASMVFVLGLFFGRAWSRAAGLVWLIAIAALILSTYGPGSILATTIGALTASGLLVGWVFADGPLPNQRL
jgi:O-antigen/teichoic acid export membrane protein